VMPKQKRSSELKSTCYCSNRFSILLLQQHSLIYCIQCVITKLVYVSGVEMDVCIVSVIKLEKQYHKRFARKAEYINCIKI